VNRRTSATRGPRRTTGDPYRLGLAAPFIAPLLAAAGLFLVGALTLMVLGGHIPFLPSRGGDTGGVGPGASSRPGAPSIVPGRTPSPSAPVEVNPEVVINGRIVYAKAGNLWIQEGTAARQLTKTGRDSQPAWSSDGQWIYFIETRHTRGKFALTQTLRWYELNYPILTRIKPDGSGREALLSGLYKAGGGQRWFYFIRQPAPAPDGRTVAVVSDGPDPTKRDVVLQLFDIKTKKLTRVPVTEQAPLGHQDPSWRPDGALLMYVRNGRDAGRGTPEIYRYDPKSKRARAMSGPGYMEPVYSPDGRYLAATRTGSFGTDVVVLDARTGGEILRVTSDEHSWGAAWSPDGTQIAFLRLEGLTVDLQLATLSGSAGSLAVASEDSLTEFSGLDPASRPSWWGPRPSPAASPVPSGESPAPSPSVP
jgi:dipeptidyl aminopeptidase/acylaminoacyl peptidase